MDGDDVEDVDATDTEEKKSSSDDGGGGVADDKLAAAAGGSDADSISTGCVIFVNFVYSLIIF